MGSVEVRLDDVVLILLIGLRDDEGELEISPGQSVFSEVSLFKVLHQLSEEFPGFFPGLHFETSGKAIPYSKELESVLFQLGAWRTATLDGAVGNRRIQPEIKIVI